MGPRVSLRRASFCSNATCPASGGRRPAIVFSSVVCRRRWGRRRRCLARRADSSARRGTPAASNSRRSDLRCSGLAPSYQRTEIRFADFFVRQDLPGRSERDWPAAIEHNAALGDFRNKFDVVFDDDHCGAARLQLQQQRFKCSSSSTDKPIAGSSSRTSSGLPTAARVKLISCAVRRTVCSPRRRRHRPDRKMQFARARSSAAAFR